MNQNLEHLSRHATDAAGLAQTFGLPIPKDLAATLAAYGEATAYGGDDDFDVSVEANQVAPGAVVALIDRAADRAAHQAYALEAKDHVLEGLARRLVTQTHGAGPALIEAAAPLFTEAAEAFTVAAARLPAGYEDSAALVAAGSAAVAALEAAHAQLATLDALASLRTALAELGVRAAGDAQVEAGTRYAAVKNTAAARRAAVAHKNNPGPLGRWGALRATKGVTGLAWLTIPAQAAYIAALPQEENRYESTVTNGFRGARLVEA